MLKKKLTVITLFTGMGYQEFALNNIFDPVIVATSEIDREVITLYAEIHHNLTTEMAQNYDAYPDMPDMVRELTDKNIGYNPDNKRPFDWSCQEPELVKKTWLAVHLNRNLGDISRIDVLPYADLWTVSSPCTDISVAGLQKGFAPDSGTRSALLWEQIRLLQKAVDDGRPPVFLVFENVSSITHKKSRPVFDRLIRKLSDLGFNTYWDILNSKDFGTPQSRERMYAVCVRKDLDNSAFSFPQPTGPDISLDDILDPRHEAVRNTAVHTSAPAAVKTEAA